MRSLQVCLLLCGSLAYCAIESPRTGTNGSADSVGRASDDWRRTAQGWQRVSDWPQPKTKAAAVRLHPAVVAAWQVLVCLGALVAGATVVPMRIRTAQRKPHFVGRPSQPAAIFHATRR